MLNVEGLLQRLDRVAAVARGGALGRLFRHPLRYLRFVVANKLRYRLLHQHTLAKAPLFFGGSMQVALPAGTDVFLAGGKTHHSEIRLARFLIRTLNTGDVFWDIGAHFGYFSLLAAKLVGKQGRVMAFEPSVFNGALLQKNTADAGNIEVKKAAVSDSVGELRFFEFPALFSEYNSLDVAQFEEQSWYRRAAPVEHIVPAVSLDGIVAEGRPIPSLLKMDVEGAEDRAIAGAEGLLSEHSPTVVMEYLADERHNSGHRKAASLLANMGYSAFAINEAGALSAVDDIARHLQALNTDSDNIVFRR